MSELISEPIAPEGDRSTAAMGRGEPGLPQAFVWRDRAYGVIKVVSAWKQSGREGGRATADLYLRRHYYELLMDDESLWTVYFLRQTPKTGNARQRWFLYTRQDA
ncbi:MAG: DUF6504 family protein [Planctomycetota bacterium]|jgi:hypothetical protein